jgi:predicted dehydrogenase
MEETAMSSTELRVGFVGVGSMGQCAHLRHYATLDGCRVTAVAELREETGRAVARRYGVPACYRTAADMLAKESLDALVASQPFSRHGVVLGELLDAGLPVFIEKPLAWSVQVGRSILDQIAASNGRVMVGYNKRSDPATMRAKAEIDRLKHSGACGAMRYVRITMPPGDWIQGGFTGRIDAGDLRPELARDPKPDDLDDATHDAYVTFVNFYIHQVNLLRHLLGEDYRVAFADPSGVLLAVESESGVCGVIEMAPYRTTRTWEESALVGFERGFVRIDLPAPLERTHAGRVRILRDRGDGAEPVVEEPALPTRPGMRQQAMNFVAFARGEAPAPCDAAEALKDLVVARQYIDLMKGGR